MQSTLGPNHPQAKALKAQIDELSKEIDKEQKRLLLQAKQNFIIARTNEDQTSAALEAQKTDAYKLRDDLVEYTLRQREFESNRTLYEGLLQKLRTAGVRGRVESDENYGVESSAPPAHSPREPRAHLSL